MIDLLDLATFDLDEITGFAGNANEMGLRVADGVIDYSISNQTGDVLLLRDGPSAAIAQFNYARTPLRDMLYIIKLIDGIDPYLDIDFSLQKFYHTDINDDILAHDLNILFHAGDNDDFLSYGGEDDEPGIIAGGMGFVNHYPGGSDYGNQAIAAYGRTNDDFSRRWLATHEIGHALGLSHLDWGSGNQYTNDSEYDSVMLKGWQANLNRFAPGYGFSLNDIAALQLIWGVERDYQRVPGQGVMMSQLELFKDGEGSYFLKKNVEVDADGAANDKSYIGREEIDQFVYPRFFERGRGFDRFIDENGLSIVDAETIAGQNLIAQQMMGLNNILTMRVVTMDSDWWQARSGDFFQDKSAQWFETEQAFQNDFNGDSIIGLKSIEKSDDKYKLMMDGNKNYFVASTSKKRGSWNALTDEEGNPIQESKDFSILGVTKVPRQKRQGQDSRYQLVLENKADEELWLFNATKNWTMLDEGKSFLGSLASDNLSGLQDNQNQEISSSLARVEDIFSQDFNRDGFF